MIELKTISDNFGYRVILSDTETPTGELCGIECGDFSQAMKLGFAISDALESQNILFVHTIEHVRLDL